MMPKKFVSSEEYAEARRNRDYTNVIEFVLKNYRKFLDRHEQQSCGDIALLKCLQYYDPSFNTKVTTSLVRFVHWECGTLTRQKSRRQSRLHQVPWQPLTGGGNENDFAVGEELVSTLVKPGEMEQYLSCLSQQERELLESRFSEGLTLIQIGEKYHYSRQTAHIRLQKVLEKLKKAILDGVL